MKIKRIFETIINEDDIEELEQLEEEEKKIIEEYDKEQITDKRRLEILYRIKQIEDRIYELTIKNEIELDDPYRPEVIKLEVSPEDIEDTEDIEEIEKFFIGVAQILINRSGYNKEDLKDLIEDQIEEEPDITNPEPDQTAKQTAFRSKTKIAVKGDKV